MRLDGSNPVLLSEERSRVDHYRGVVGRVPQLAAEGCGVVVTGHEVRALRPFLDSVTWVTAGTTYPLGTPEEAWKNDRFRREYLGE